MKHKVVEMGKKHAGQFVGRSDHRLNMRGTEGWPKERMSFYTSKATALLNRIVVLLC